MWLCGFLVELRKDLGCLVILAWGLRERFGCLMFRDFWCFGFAGFGVCA